MLSQDYDGKVQVVNNKRVSVTLKRSIYDAVELAEQGKNAAEIKEILEKTAHDSAVYIMVDTLSYLKKGGRITAAAAAIGTLLKIKPVLQIQGDKLDAFSKARTVKQAKSTMINAIKAAVAWAPQRSRFLWVTNPTVVIVMKIAEAELIKQATEQEPIVLLDDVLSELDSRRQKFLLNKIDNRQVFISCCERASADRLEGGKLFYVENGEIMAV